jgi:flagellar hook assembly protein FlgD
LSQNYPNPFNPVTRIDFVIPFVETRLMASLRIYDILGREVTTLVNGQLKPGTYEIEWDATNYPSGVYYYTLTTGDYKETRKMILLR